jgi:hypothetical protein
MRGTEEYKYEFDAVDMPNWTLRFSNPASTHVDVKVKVDLLHRSLKHRVKHEALLWRHAVKTYGLFSREALNHIMRRMRVNITEGVHKVKAPEMPLHLGVHQKKGKGSLRP